MFEIGLAIWIGSAIASAIIASGKNRNGVGWFVIGILLGVFALIIIICLPGFSAAQVAEEDGPVETLFDKERRKAAEKKRKQESVGMG